jgi:membrane protein involved in colicin uptake
MMETLKSLFGKAKSEASELAEKSKPMMEKAKVKAGEAIEASKPMMEKAKVKAGEAIEASKPMMEKAKVMAGEAVEKAKETAGEVWDKVEHKMEERRQSDSTEEAGGQEVSEAAGDMTAEGGPPPS